MLEGEFDIIFQEFFPEDTDEDEISVSFVKIIDGSSWPADAVAMIQKLMERNPGATLDQKIQFIINLLDAADRKFGPAHILATLAPLQMLKAILGANPETVLPFSELNRYLNMISWSQRNSIY